MINMTYYYMNGLHVNGTTLNSCKTVVGVIISTVRSYIRTVQEFETAIQLTSDLRKFKPCNKRVA